MTELSAIVTGAGRGIGLAVSQMLLQEGYTVHGIARSLPDNLQNEKFLFHKMDLSDIDSLEKNLSPLKKLCSNLKVLVLNAGIGLFGLHEELPIKKLNEMMLLNFVSPVITARIFLRLLKNNQGTMVTVSSASSLRGSALAAAYSGTKAGLSQFSRSVFDESRKSGLRVVNIVPDIVSTDFYRNNWFEPESENDSFLYPEEVAEAVRTCIGVRPEMNISEIHLEPRLKRIRKKKFLF
ncbi:MAG TPA: SDR family oxidoreductase [Leptospiraceae bacterium]|nr:SDR family oxidoreductase [Leptospiraceae bacterium]